jgi:hypothetical protein
MPCCFVQRHMYRLKPKIYQENDIIGAHLQRCCQALGSKCGRHRLSLASVCYTKKCRTTRARLGIAITPMVHVGLVLRNHKKINPNKWVVVKIVVKHAKTMCTEMFYG